MALGPSDHPAPPASSRRRTREHPSEGKWLGTAEVTNERDVRGRGRRRGLRGWVARPEKSWLDHWIVRYLLLVVLLCFALLVVEAAKAAPAGDGFVPVPELKARVGLLSHAACAELATKALQQTSATAVRALAAEIS